MRSNGKSLFRIAFYLAGVVLIAQTNFATSKGGAAEAGNWRVEISPDVPSRADAFLHVLSVIDDTVPKGPAVRQIASGNLIGFQVLDLAVLFSRNGELLTNADFTFENPTRVLLCDMATGSQFVTKDGTHFATVQATNDGRCVFLEAGPGTYRLEAAL